MLYLQRNVGEIINIDDDIEIIIKSINGRIVTLGIAAPKDKMVFRNEVYIAKKLGLSKSTSRTYKKMMVKRYGRIIKRAAINPPAISESKE